jgi:hypothetical protein
MQQYLANWLSAFCAATGLVVHPAKIYPTVVGPVPSMFAAAQDATTASDALTSIVIYDTAWTPIRCPILPSLPTTKYLGVYLDLKQKLDSHQPVLADLHRDLSHLLVQPASPKVKIDLLYSIQNPADCPCYCNMFQLVAPSIPCTRQAPITRVSHYTCPPVQVSRICFIPAAQTAGNRSSSHLGQSATHEMGGASSITIGRR